MIRGRGRFKDVEVWPEPDRSLWHRGLSPASLLDAGGHSLKWDPATVHMNCRAYASYLNWLEHTGQLRADEGAEQRATPERLDAYCADLESSKLSSPTIRLRSTGLASALSLLAPAMDISFVWQRRNRYSKHGDRLAKRARMQEPAALLQLGLDLMAEAEGQIPATRRSAVLYRDGLIIALLACRVLRLRNLTAIEMGRHLKETDARWSLRFAEAETKNHRLWTNAWPELLLPQLLRYLQVYRPLLMDGRYEGNELWISERPGPLTDNGIYYAIITRTKAVFDLSVNPHLFRHAAATSLAVYEPSNVLINRHVLGHGSYATSEEYYNQARSLEASTRLNTAIERRRPRRN
jgi:integrase